MCIRDRCLQRVNTDDLLISRDLNEHERTLPDAQRHAQIHRCKYTYIGSNKEVRLKLASKGHKRIYLWESSISFQLESNRHAVKDCCKWLDSLNPQQELAGGLPLQQASVTVRFKMASKMAVAASSLH